MRFTFLAAARTLHKLHPEVMDNRECLSGRSARCVQGGDGFAHGGLKGAQRRDEVLEASRGQLGLRHRAGDGVHIDADGGSAEPCRLDDRGPAPDERIEDGESRQVRGLVIGLPEVRGRRFYGADKEGAE
jgi:hypothetical protein